MIVVLSIYYNYRNNLSTIWPEYISMSFAQATNKRIVAQPAIFYVKNCKDPLEYLNISIKGTSKVRNTKPVDLVEYTK